MGRQYVIVVGCGRLGVRLAEVLSLDGEGVVVVDRDERTFEKFSQDFSGYYVAGDATEPHVLREARTDEARCLLAVTDLDNVNLMVAQLAKELFGVPQLLARVYNPAHEPIYRAFGIAIVNPTELSAQQFLQEIRTFEDEGTNP